MLTVGTHDLVTFSIESAALVAVSIPAPRATRVNPVVALREE